MNYGAETDAPSVQDDERRVQDFLTGHGWVLSGSAELFLIGDVRILQFRVPGCARIVAIALLPSNAEMASLFARAGGPDARVFHVHRGRTLPDPPRFAYLQARVAGLIEALGFWPRASSSVVSVSQPQECRLEAALPWSEL